MFKKNKKKELLDKYRITVKNYNKVFSELNKYATKNFKLKLNLSEDLIVNLEKIVAGTGNFPLEHLAVYYKFKNAHENFKDFKYQYENETEKVDDGEKLKAQSYKKEGILGATGTTLGVSISTLGPTAATAIASTYGVASTGTAITALSGAAAQSATLAWLGGGSLAAGGGGMAAGTSLLALFGPVGIALSAVSLIGTGSYSVYKANKYIKVLQKDLNILNKAINEEIPNAIKNLESNTKEVNKIKNVISPQFEYLKRYTPGNFDEYNDAEKEELQNFMETIKMLTANLNGFKES